MLAGKRIEDESLNSDSLFETAIKNHSYTDGWFFIAVYFTAKSILQAAA